MSVENVVSPGLLREWELPSAGESKYGRGQVVVIGGATRSPGAAMLAGLASLRVGAGRLTLAVARSIAGNVAVAVPECGVVPLEENDLGSVRGAGLAAAEHDLSSADAVIVGPGLDDADETVALLRALPGMLADDCTVVLDAFALGACANLPELAEPFAGRLVLTPNKGEATRMLGRDLGDDLGDDIAELATRYGGVVTCFDRIAAPDGRRWRSDAGNPGLATSGSGDVLSGAIAGFAARGADPAQAGVWGTHVHGVAGTRLAARISPLGYLARELLDELPSAIVETL